MTPGAAALALAIGLSMGVLGGGGSIIAVPALTFLLHFPPKEAVVTSLAIVGAVAAVGAISAIVRGAMPVALAAVVGVAAIAGAYAGGLAGSHLADRTQLLLLAVIMLVAALVLWRRSDHGQQVSGLPRPRPHPLLLAALGVSVGAITGLVGVGGGFLIVPALVIWARQPMQQAAAASLFVIALAALAAIPGYAGRVTLDWSFIAPFVAIGGCGVVAGGVVAQYLPQRRLQRAFAAALAILASYVLTRA